VRQQWRARQEILLDPLACLYHYLADWRTRRVRLLLPAGKNVIILNADDWGRSQEETDAALYCHRLGRLSSATAMLFMKDSERAAYLAAEARLDIGLHVNFTEPFTCGCNNASLITAQERVIAYFRSGPRAFLIYNPLLTNALIDSYRGQREEFLRRYGREPSHLDGHQHAHLCANMLIDKVIPKGEKVRRTFHFWPGEKNIVNRTTRRFLNYMVDRRYRSTDYFFALSQSIGRERLARIKCVAQTATVEIMTHPVVAREKSFICGKGFAAFVDGLETGTYASI
jgi:predicted glycoside hydrolase/deacetylase ChbG (UPF0249 family)